MLEAKQKVNYHDPKAKTTVEAEVLSVGAKKVWIITGGKKRCVQYHNVEPIKQQTMAAATLQPPAKPRVSMFRAANDAANYAKPDDFVQVRKGFVTSRGFLLSRRNVWLIVFWGKYTLSLCEDGKLMMVVGDIAYQVNTSADILRDIFASHRQAEWWVKR